MLIDTDVLIWNLRGNERAASMLDGSPGFMVSAVTYMELLQGLRNKDELRVLRQAMHYWGARLIPVDTEICGRATYLVEEYALSHAMQMADAMIAATAMHLGEVLVTANDRHYRHIDGLTLEVFRPK
ncbi:type II toxin-antitoxin system VapC family toxin [Ectothiorhodospira sp. BSL-9]|uniref:type II toxin-antitoxin system VapC family toxin n=1 Tax=Ectothiorhodospira sp. BSL-9 TaxID=1442136 RepID=UPI0007B45AE0|nr:type II toxin-antitoxin system VapC family toxin [Ectothiorhodospira sp. BSL-9]ANB03792.1 twitching motility protein PilT [Ectothiorhodospira sp. BSL-9]